MTIEKVIVLGNEFGLRNSLENYLRRNRYDVAGASTIAMARGFLNKDNFDLIFLDLTLPDGDGLNFLRELQARPQKILAVITAGSASIESAVECIKSGAFDYLIRPFSEDQIGVTLRKAEEFVRLVRVSRLLSRDNEEIEHPLLGQSREMENLKQLIHKVAHTNATVLIQGESGTGKEAIARALYRESARACAPFIKVNCAAIPENLIESEFFGHEKGAFTGALTKREGRFELAHGGTILLDEISEISPSLQAKLLRVLQEREFERVGGNRTIRVDVRVIATTNRNLEQSVGQKEFRQDLFYRLNVVPIRVAPLREHREDVLLLKREFMQRFSRRHGIHIQGITDEARQALLKHSWPGNVRELQNVIERAVIMAGDNAILEQLHLGLAACNPSNATGAGPDQALKILDDSSPVGDLSPLAEVEKRHILKVLDHCQGNRTHAANLLGISVRTMRNKLHEYGESTTAMSGEPATNGH